MRTRFAMVTALGLAGCPLPEVPKADEDSATTGTTGTTATTPTLDCALSEPWEVVDDTSLAEAEWWLIPNLIGWTTVQIELTEMAETYGCPVVDDSTGAIIIGGDCVVDGVVEVHGTYTYDAVADDTVLDGFDAWWLDDEEHVAAGDGYWHTDSTDAGAHWDGDAVTRLVGIESNDGYAENTFTYDCVEDASSESCVYEGYARVYESPRGFTGDFCERFEYVDDGTCDTEWSETTVLVGDHTLVERGDAAECDGCYAVTVDREEMEPWCPE